MKAQTEGFEILIGLAALIFVAAVAFVIFSGGSVKSELPKGQEEVKLCQNDDDCTGNANGNRCMQIRTAKGLEDPFCGCLTNKDCKSGIECTDNICANNTALVN